MSAFLGTTSFLVQNGVEGKKGSPDSYAIIFLHSFILFVPLDREVDKGSEDNRGGEKNEDVKRNVNQNEREESESQWIQCLLLML